MCLAGKSTRESITAGATALRGIQGGTGSSPGPRPWTAGVNQATGVFMYMGNLWFMPQMEKAQFIQGTKWETSHFRNGGYIKPRCCLDWGTEFSENLPTSRHLAQSAITTEIFLPHGGSPILNPLNLIPGPSLSSGSTSFSRQLEHAPQALQWLFRARRGAHNTYLTLKN